MIARIVDQDGTVVTSSLDGLTVTEVRRVLNGPATAQLEVATVAPGLDALVSEDGDTVREIQILDDTDLVLWGVPVAVEESQPTTSIRLADPLWLLGKRVVGDLQEDNLLTNPSFEGGETAEVPDGWTNDGVETITTGYSVNALDGSRIVSLESSSPSVNRCLYQDVTIPAASEPEIYIGSAACWVEPLVPFVPTDYELGLVLKLLDDNGRLRDEWWWRLNDGADRFFWTRHSVPITVPPHDDPWTIRFWLSSPQGQVYYDNCRLVKVRREVFLGTDQASIAQALVEHAQDPALNKADLGIDCNCAATGIGRNRVYPWAEHAVILDALTELADADLGIDFEMVCTTTTKTFTTHWPAKGSDLAETWTLGGEILAYTRSGGLATAVGSVAVMGEGTTDAEGRADDRDRQWFADQYAHSGRMLEAIERAPSRASTGEMLDQAREAVDTGHVPHGLTVTLSGFRSRFIARTIDVGDTVRIVIDHGSVQVDHDYRLVELGLDPRSGIVTPTLELVDEVSS